MNPKSPGVNFGDIVQVMQSKDINALRGLLKRKNIELIDKRLETVLHTAARLGDVDVIKTLLEDWRVVRHLDSEMYNGDTPLVAAARSNNVAAIQVLADHGANIWKQKLECGTTTLHFAATLHDSELMNTLVARNPPPKVINKTNKFGETAFDVALKHHLYNFQVLLQAGADFSKPNTLSGRNVLHTCVAYNQCGVLQELLSSQNSRKLTNMVDRKGDTPLMLAIRMGCLRCVQSLIKFITLGKEINEVTGESLLHMAVQTDIHDIMSEILNHSHEHVINYKDFEGRTPLLLAIESEKNQCLKKLMATQNVYEKNGITDDTALHTAVRVNNVEAQNLLMESNEDVGTWCFSQPNRDGKTPLWVAIETDNAQFVAEARKGRWISVDQLNHRGDSCTYVAAACGHIKVLKTLLLSDKFYKFCRTYERDIEFKGKTLVKEAEISCDMYCSDIYILTDEIRKNRSHSWFPKTFLNVTYSGRNIFHACALGGDVYCMDFIFTFVKMFSPTNLYLFDEKDGAGNTPLQLATRNELQGPECVYYLLSHRGNMSSQNNKGEFVLESILRSTEHSTELLNSVLNRGIVYDQEIKGLQEESENLRVNFSILRPSQPIINVVRLFYDKIHGEQRFEVLEHTLFKMYVHLVLTSVNYFFVIRFLVSCFSTLLLTMYLVLFCNVPGEAPAVQFMRYSLRFVNLFGLLLTVPLLLHVEFCFIGILTISLMVLPCLMVLILTVIPHGSNLFFELAAITVLVAFFSLQMYSTTVFKNISHQMAMLTQVIYGMIRFCGTVIFVLCAFSLAFYCIFNNSFYFVSPFKSFIYTSNILLLDDTSKSYNFFHEKHFSKNKTNSDGSANKMSQMFANKLDLYFECAIIFAFIIMVNLALTNMLVSLAVRDGKTLEASGSIFRRHLQIYWLSQLEMFLESYIYRYIKGTPLVYLFGVVPSSTLLDVEVIYYPMYQKHKSAFTQKSIWEMKRTAGRSKKRSTKNFREELEIMTTRSREELLRKKD